MAIEKSVFANLQDVLVKVRAGNEQYKRRGGIGYFKSERNIQRFLLNEGIIGIERYILNVSERFIVQVLLPNRIRSIVFRLFARE